jgi:hypothetical protein
MRHCCIRQSTLPYCPKRTAGDKVLNILSALLSHVLDRVRVVASWSTKAFAMSKASSHRTQYAYTCYSVSATVGLRTRLCCVHALPPPACTSTLSRYKNLDFQSWYPQARRVWLLPSRATSSTMSVPLGLDNILFLLRGCRSLFHAIASPFHRKKPQNDKPT